MNRGFVSMAMAACLAAAGCGRTAQTAQAPAAPAAPTQGAEQPPNLGGTSWLLEDLNGAGVVDRVQATLSFSSDGRVSGSASCNRFMGKAEVSGTGIQFGPLPATRRMCPPATMDQEGKYLAALGKATRFELQPQRLLIYTEGSDKPLRFSPLPETGPARP